jgi:hypothetical protein
MVRDPTTCEAEASWAVRSQTEVWERGPVRGIPHFEIEEARTLWTCRPSAQWVSRRLYRFGMFIILSAVFVAAFMLIVPAPIRWVWLLVWALPAMLLRSYYSGQLRQLWRERHTNVTADRLTGMVCYGSTDLCRMRDVLAVELASVPSEAGTLRNNVRLHRADGQFTDLPDWFSVLTRADAEQIALSLSDFLGCEMRS